MPLSLYYLEDMLTRVACIIAMMTYSRGFLKMLLESFSKGPRGFPYVFIIAGTVTTLEPVYGTTFVDQGIFVLGGDQ